VTANGVDGKLREDLERLKKIRSVEVSGISFEHVLLQEHGRPWH
jgi:hypothetical protein